MPLKILSGLGESPKFLNDSMELKLNFLICKWKHGNEMDFVFKQRLKPCKYICILLKSVARVLCPNIRCVGRNTVRGVATIYTCPTVNFCWVATAQSQFSNVFIFWQAYKHCLRTAGNRDRIVPRLHFQDFTANNNFGPS